MASDPSDSESDNSDPVADDEGKDSDPYRLEPRQARNQKYIKVQRLEAEKK